VKRSGDDEPQRSTSVCVLEMVGLIREVHEGLARSLDDRRLVTKRGFETAFEHVANAGRRVQVKLRFGAGRKFDEVDSGLEPRKAVDWVLSKQSASYLGERAREGRRR